MRSCVMGLAVVRLLISLINAVHSKSPTNTGITRSLLKSFRNMTCPWLAVLPTFSGSTTKLPVSFVVTLASPAFPCPGRSPSHVSMSWCVSASFSTVYFGGLSAGDVVPPKTDTRMGGHFVLPRPSRVLRRARLCFDVFLVSFRGANLSSFPRSVHVFRRFFVFYSFGGSRETCGSFARPSLVSKSLPKRHVRETFFFVLHFFFLSSSRVSSLSTWTLWFRVRVRFVSCSVSITRVFVSFVRSITHRCPRTLARIVLVRRLGLRDVHVRHPFHVFCILSSFRPSPRARVRLSHGSIQPCTRSATWTA
mmetsp:Transcript_3179/g.19641  ORF Transcript_3179/g.19641 Transcript_3179/m.19641 type:complete len:307 (+) Transcript_3179:2467-3387(+)